MQADFKKYTLQFKRPSGTSRGTLYQKDSYFIRIWDGTTFGLGECGLLRGLSVDDVPEYESKLAWACKHIHLGLKELYGQLQGFPSIQFGLEQAFLSFGMKDPYKLFPSPFTDQEQPIPINGLVWMGNQAFMEEQIRDKIQTGFSCIKMKIGALDFKQELLVLQGIRKKFGKSEIELRVDANGAFSTEETPEVLRILADLEVHSIEQPIKAGSWDAMGQLCAQTPTPIALDEELIGVHTYDEKKRLLDCIQPQYIILKPSLLGGYAACEAWISLAEGMGIGWWITSALESNLGLNAIAQWTYSLGNPMPQGLGTGSLYTNNLQSPLRITKGQLVYDRQLQWNAKIWEQICT